MTKPKYLNDKDPWMLAEDIPDIDMFFAQIWQSGFTHEFKYPAGKAYKKVLCVYRGNHLWFYFGEKDSFEVGEHLVNSFFSNPSFATKVNKEIIKEADKLREFAEKLSEEGLSNLDKKDLWDIYKKHDKMHTEYYQWCWISVAVDMFHNNLTDKLKRYLRGIDVTEDKMNEHLTLLTQPTKKSLIQIEQDEFLKIAEKIQKDKYHNKLFKDLYKLFEEKEAMPYGLATHTPEYEGKLEKKMDEIRDKIKMPIYKLIEKHYQKYFYVKFMWIGKDGVSSFDHYLKELVKFIGQGGNASKILTENTKGQKNILEKRKKLIQKLGIKGKHLTLINAFGDFMVTKIYRRYAQIYAIYRMQPVLDEIAKRLGITKTQVRFMLTREVGEALLKNKINKDALAKRTKFCVYYTENGTEEVFLGEKAKKLAKKVEAKEVGETSEMQGQTGCVGKAKGIVKVIIRPKDMVKMNKGDILVSIATDPDIVPAMKKAGAIVTEQGGVTSHAAIVARELNIPCLIGTKIATRVLKDGDEVEVDATKGIVKKIK